MYHLVMNGIHRIIQNSKVWKRYKEASIRWAEYDASTDLVNVKILDLQRLFNKLDTPVQRREFKLSNLIVLFLFRILFGIGYRGIASAAKDLEIYLKISSFHK